LIRLWSSILLLLGVAYAAELQRAVPVNTESPPLKVTLSNARSAIADIEEAPGSDQARPSHALDDIPCVREFAPLEFPVLPDLLSLDSATTLYYWTKSEDCFQCGPSEPIRIESIYFVVSRPDGSPADTIDFEIKLLCSVDSDPCAGFGLSRGTRYASFVFAADESDGQDEITIVALEFAGILADSSGGFLSVMSLGTRAGSIASLVSEQNSEFVAEDCKVWVKSSALFEWNALWGPNHGAPMAQIAWTCDLADTVVIPPCPDSCSFARFIDLQSYFDPSSNIVYQWIDPDPGFFPLKPTSLDLKLYFESLGSATDRAYFRILLSCTSFDALCCPPGEPLCSISASVARGTAFQTVLDVHVPLENSVCCLSGPFWLGIVIDSVTGGAALPSFLYSARSIDPTPPLPCEQWTGRSGQLISERSDDIAWADLRLNANCHSCSENEPQTCTTLIQSLDCGYALFVACSEDGAVLSGQEILPGVGGTERYCCSDLKFLGREQVYRMQIPNQGNLSIHAATDTLQHVALFLLETCDPHHCVMFGVDSLSATGLTNGEYFIVAESFDTTGQSFDLLFECIAYCNHETCVNDLRGTSGVGNRYLDGEGDGVGNTFFQSYYPGTGSNQRILRFDAETCDSLASISWQSTESGPSRMLAYDPRNGGEYWCGTSIDFFSGTGKLYRISSGGGVVQSWTSIPGLPILRWSGAAFDPTHNHLWVLIRDSSNTGNSRAYELDLSNPLQPVVIQGPHPLAHQSPNQSLSCAGADYAQLSNHLLVVHQGSPEDFVQCYDDLVPAYSGPRPGPGLAPLAWCTPDSNSQQGYGIAAIEDSTGGRIAMTNFTDADWAHPVAMYPPPCRLIPERCLSPIDMTIWADGTIANLKWTSIYSGTYEIYSSVDPSNDGDPDNGDDTLFTLETRLELTSGPAQWQDTDTPSGYKTYVIVVTCATQSQ
jgi:hypothetical protein